MLSEVTLLISSSRDLMLETCSQLRLDQRLENFTSVPAHKVLCHDTNSLAPNPYLSSGVVRYTLTRFSAVDVSSTRGFSLEIDRIMPYFIELAS